MLSAILTSVDGPCDQLIKDPKNAGKLQAMKDLINRINSRDNLAVVEESLESQACAQLRTRVFRLSDQFACRKEVL